MSRRVRWSLLVLIIVLVGGAVTLVVLERPRLNDAREAVDTRWAPLRAADGPLAVRYQKLEAALLAFEAAGGTGRAAAKDLHAALLAWNRALKSGDAGDQAAAADVLEVQATRLRANVNASDRLKTNAALNDALTVFAGTKPPDALIAAYNTAVREYEDERTGTLQRPVARVLGYDQRPRLVLGA
jgi:hypothetical protein